MALVNITGGILVNIVWFICFLIGRKLALLLGFLLSFTIFIPLIYGSKCYVPCMLGQELGTWLIYHGQTKLLHQELSRERHIVTLQLMFLKEILNFSDLTFKVTDTIIGEIGIHWPIQWMIACISLYAQAILILLEVIKYRGDPPMAKNEFEQNKVTLEKFRILMEIEDIISSIINCFLSGMSIAFMGVIYCKVLKKLLPGDEDVSDTEIAFSGAMIELGGVIFNRIVEVEQRTKDFLVAFGICFHIGLLIPIFYQKELFYTSKSMLLLSSAIVFKMKDVLPVDNTMGTINACPTYLKTTLFAIYSSSTSFGKGIVLFLLPHITLNTILVFHLALAVLKEWAYYRARKNARPGPKFTKDAATQNSKEEFWRKKYK